MYGDCQVMSHHHHQQQHMMLLGDVGGGGDVVAGGGAGMAATAPSTDSLFMVGSHVPGSGFMGGGGGGGGFQPLHHHTFASIMPHAEDMESGGYVEDMDQETLADQQQHQGLGGHQHHQLQHQQNKKKRYHRHTVHQIQQMEALFKECPHPDDKQRLKLSQDLGLKPRQIKFWFQNRRTQLKMQQDRHDNAMLRAENEGLKCDNYRLRAAMQNVACPSCGGGAILGELSFDKHHIRLENARLKEELDRYSNLLRYHSPNIGSMAAPPLRPLEMGLYSSSGYGHGGHQQHLFLFDDHDKPLGLNLTVAAAASTSDH